MRCYSVLRDRKVPSGEFIYRLPCPFLYFVSERFFFDLYIVDNRKTSWCCSFSAVAVCFKAADFVLGEAREKGSRRRIFIRRGQLFEQQRSIRRKQRFKGAYSSAG